MNSKCKKIVLGLSVFVLLNAGQAFADRYKPPHITIPKDTYPQMEEIDTVLVVKREKAPASDGLPTKGSAAVKNEHSQKTEVKPSKKPVSDSPPPYDNGAKKVDIKQPITTDPVKDPIVEPLRTPVNCSERGMSADGKTCTEPRKGSSTR